MASMRTWLGGWLALGGWLLAAASAHASVVLGEHDWDLPAGGTLGWSNTLGNATVDRAATGGNTGGWLRVTFPSDPQLPSEYTELVRLGTASDLFAGNWNTSMWVQFDFWVDDVAPAAIEVRWQETNGVAGGSGGYVWAYGLPATTVGWNTLRAPLLDYDDWRDPFGPSAAQYLADLSAIDWIGVYIQRGAGMDGQIYGLDEFKLMVPEPAEYLMLAAVAAGAGLLRRRRALVA